MKKIITIVASFALAMSAMVSCNDLKEIEGRVDGLENRVETLENACKTLNANVEALKAFLDGKKTITSFTEEKGVYTIELSDGSKITLNQGSEGEAVMPNIAIDKDGFWTLDGKQILSNGKPVPATGNDGATPIFGVDKDGYWTVKYSEEETPKQVLGADGKPVKAVGNAPTTQGTNDKFFEKVEVVNNAIEITLKDGKKYSLPIIPDFMCAIQGADAQPIVFAPGEKKSFNVTLKGVAQTLLYAPSQWNASLTGNSLTVTAPTALTKASADTREDVSILAISNTGFSAIAKIRVQLGDKPVVQTPSASVTAGEATENSLTFTVSVSNATEWHYMLKKSSETQPTVQELKAATKGTETTLALTTDHAGANLTASTEYTLYILPVGAEGDGAIASLKSSTTAKVFASLYDAYCAGENIEIAGKVYNQTTNGKAILLSATAPDTELRDKIHQKAGIFFLNQSEGASFKTSLIAEIKNDVVLIGNNKTGKVKIKQAKNWKLMSGSLVMKNIEFDMELINGKTTNDTYAFNNGNSTADLTALHIEDCDIINIQKPITYMSLATHGITSLKVLNSSMQITTTVANTILFNFYKSSTLDHYKEIVFNNNIVYSNTAVAIQVCNFDHTIVQNGTSWGTLEMNNNTFYNVVGKNGYIKFYQFSKANCQKNIFYADQTYNSSASYMFVLYGQSNGIFTVDTNIAFGMDATKNWDIAHANSTWKPKPNRIEKLKATPFQQADATKGIFTPTTEYVTYGAQR